MYDAVVKLNLSKCRLGVRRVEVLGHYVGPEGVRPAAGHTKAIQVLQKPDSVEELLSFLGLTKYFSRFIDRLQTWRGHSTRYLRGLASLKMKKEAAIYNKGMELQVEARKTEEWKSLKAVLSDPQVLESAKLGKPKKVMTGASVYGVEGVLIQLDGVEWIPIAFISRKIKEE